MAFLKLGDETGTHDKGARFPILPECGKAYSDRRLNVSTRHQLSSHECRRAPKKRTAPTIRLNSPQTAVSQR